MISSHEDNESVLCNIQYIITQSALKQPSNSEIYYLV